MTLKIAKLYHLMGKQMSKVRCKGHYFSYE